MNAKSMTQIEMGVPPTVAVPQTAASVAPVEARACDSRSG